MAKYCYEYGQRWNSRMPRNSIKRYVNRQHVGTPIEDILALVNEVVDTSPHIPATMRPAIECYTRAVHKANRDLYHFVMR